MTTVVAVERGTDGGHHAPYRPEESSSMTATQLELFGTPEPAQPPFGVAGWFDLAVADRLEARRQARRVLEQRACWWPDGTAVIWTAPWDCSGGMRKGDTCPGWRCWLCGDVEISDYKLALNHGLNSSYPDSLDRPECAAQQLRRSQEASRLEQAAKAAARAGA